MALVIIVGIGLLAFSLKTAFESLLVDKPDASVIELASAETRDAIDSQMPRMFDYLNGSAEEAYALFTEEGWNVLLDPREATDNRADKTAVGGRVIHLSPAVEHSILDQGYYEGGFNAYDLDELQRSFNGMWVLDISHGESGAYSRLEYVNFASTSLDDELGYLQGSQDLIGDNSAMDSKGVDSYGNSYIRGYTVIEETTYYWELIGIAFGEYYRGQDRRTLPPTSVFVKCTIADFDFYGAGETLATELPPEEEQTEEESTEEEQTEEGSAEEEQTEEGA
jgi:hypothetical protein